MSYLRIEHVSKRFGDSDVLHQLSLEVEKGELITLLGSSGCGKSTLLRCISGLVSLEQGEIYLDDKPITGVAPKDRGVGMVFQSYALFPNMTVSENIAFGLNMRRKRKKDLELRVNEMLQLIGLEEKRSAYPHQLSGGQQQRVALARSLAVEPKLLLLDEPLSALDAKIRKNLRMELRRIQKRLGMTTIFVTHDQEEALTISDKVCIMDRGQIVQIGSPEEVYTNPRNEFVARFIGSYNVLSSEYLQHFQMYSELTGIRFAVRPESIRLLPIGELGQLEQPERVELTELSGNSAHEYAENASGEHVLTAEGRIDEIVVLGNILRFTVDVHGMPITVDTLNGTLLHWFVVGAKVMVQIPAQACKVLGERGA